MTHSQIDKDVQDTEDWYDQQVRPFLERIAKIDVKASRLEDFDAELERLRRAREAYDDGLVVCFLGQSGIGKSTLINALVDGRRPTIPQGGIGPLTAQALSVRKGSPPGFEVTYHNPGQVWKLTTALEWGYRDELAASRAVDWEGEPGADSPADLLTEDDREELTEITKNGGQGDRSRIESLRKQAQLLVRGQQDSVAGVAYLIDGLRAILGKPPKWTGQFVDGDTERVGRLREAIQVGRYEFEGSVADSRFERELQDHAAGFLAPIIKEMSVTCDSSTLPDGVVLVDLPGLGVASDIHKKVTSEWIRNRARSVILVVHHRGIYEADAQLLQESGFLNRLSYSAETPTDDPSNLMVAVVRVDEIAADEYQRDFNRGDLSKAPEEYFDDACERASRLVIDQLRPQLLKAWASGDIQDVQARVIDNLLSDLRVHPLSAVEYRKALVRNPRLPSFLDKPESSNVPELLATLRDQTLERHRAEVRRLAAVHEDFLAKLDTTLKVIQAQWLEDTRATEEAERLREEFLGFIEPLRDEYSNRQGAYREFLRETLPQSIRAEVEKASRVARKEIAAYLRPLEEVGYRTLQAAVNKGGTFLTGSSRKIDLPNDFALRFEVPVADAWAKCVLKEIRRRTKEFADDSVRLVDQVVDWAKAQGTRIQPRLVEAQRDAIKADVKALETVGRIMVDQLRREVNSRLVTRIETPIRRRCKKFVEQGNNQGTGVKGRALKLFEQLADEVTEVSTEPAEEILLDAFRKVQEEILAVLKKHPDPLDAARDAIVKAHESYVRRSDAQRRRQVLAEIESVLEGRPEPSPDDDDDLTRAA